jgi:putative PIN family toxin of toxin-antitoxin system
MIRVVFDTNVYISALMFGGLPGELLDLAFAGAFLLVSSPTLLDELEEKLRFKFGLEGGDVDLIRSRLEKVAEMMSTTPSLAIIKADPDDDRVLECALAGRVGAIVSGDRHLLKLGAFEDIPIMTVRQFMDRVRPAI